MGSNQTLARADTIYARRESGVRSYCRHYAMEFDTASGSVARDTAGREYIDFLAGAGALNYGHNDPDMADALVAHIRRGGLAHGLDLHTSAKGGFLATFERLVLAPRDMDHRVQFTGPTGTNAVEAALKLARKVTGRRNVIVFTNGFHGVSRGVAGGHREPASSPRRRVVVAGRDAAALRRVPVPGWIPRSCSSGCSPTGPAASTPRRRCWWRPCRARAV